MFNFNQNTVTQGLVREGDRAIVGDQEQSEAPVLMAIKHLHAFLDQQGELLGLLNARLVPVLRPDAPQEATKANPRPGCCMIEGALIEVMKRLDDNNAHLNSLRNRVAI